MMHCGTFATVHPSCSITFFETLKSFKIFQQNNVLHVEIRPELFCQNENKPCNFQNIVVNFRGIAKIFKNHNSYISALPIDHHRPSTTNKSFN